MTRSCSSGEPEEPRSATQRANSVFCPHLVLVGLPGAGKSTVGRMVAERLGCQFLDFDLEIERRTGRSVSEIFTELGEPEFRRLEAELTSELAALPPMVMAPGGGWMAIPDARRRLGNRGRTIYLRVTVGAALARLRGSDTVRPLLAGSAPEEVLDRLTREREAIYNKADAEVDTEDVDTNEVTQLVLALATRWGWPVG